MIALSNLDPGGLIPIGSPKAEILLLVIEASDCVRPPSCVIRLDLREKKCSIVVTRWLDQQ